MYIFVKSFYKSLGLSKVKNSNGWSLCSSLHSFICPLFYGVFPPPVGWLGENFEVLQFKWLCFFGQCVIFFLYLVFYLLIAFGCYSWCKPKHYAANWNIMINIDLMILITYCWPLSHLPPPTSHFHH